jgi:hypothetical protein
MQVLRFFTDELSGSECAIVFNGSEEICVTADEAYDIEAKLIEDANKVAETIKGYELRCEIG